MANGMFRTGGDNTSTTGGVTVTVEPGVGLPGDVDYGTIPSDLIRDEIAETQLFRDFISKFGDKLEGKTRSQAAADWLEALVKYGSGDATLKDMQEVDVSGLMGVEGFEDYYNDIVIVQAPTDYTSIYKILKGAGYSDEAIDEIERASVDNKKFKGNNVLATILRDLGYEADNWEVQPIKNVGDACQNDDGPGTIANNGQCVTDTSEGTPCYTGSFPDEKEGRRDANGDCIPLDDGTGDGDGGTEVTGDYSEEEQNVGKQIKDWVEGQIGQVQGMTVEDVLKTVFGGNDWDPLCKDEPGDIWDCNGKDGTEGNKCWKDCVSASVLGGIPGLPMPPGNIDVGTVRDLEDKVKEIGGTIGDIFSAPQGDADDEGFIQRAKDWVLGKIDDIFGGIDDVTPGQITDWITGVLGTTISGIILQEIEGKKNDVIDKINEITGLPLDTATTLINCADYGRAGGEVESVEECDGCLDKTEDIGTDGRCRKFFKDDFDASEVETTCKREGKEYNDLLDECGDCIQDGYVPGADGVCGPIDGDVDTEVDPRCSNSAFAERNPSLCGGQTTYTEGPGFGKTKCQDRYAENYDQFGECGDCIEGYSRKTEGANCTKDETTGTVDGGGGGETDPCDTITDANAAKCGKKKCSDGSFVDANADCPGSGGPGCKPKGEVLESGCDGTTFFIRFADGECGEIYDSVPGYAGCGGGGYECDDPNATVREDGSCGPCKAGYVYDGTVEKCVQESVTNPCDDPAYAAANQDTCGGTTDCNDCTCAEYAAANPDECGTAPPPEPPSGGGGGGGGAAGGSGMFDLESFEITGDPQLLAKMEFPITDFLSGMFKDYV